MLAKVDMAQVDIVMPLYNKAKTVAESIRSIQQQTFTDWRLIVVDDGSTDDGADIVRKLDDKRVELIQQSNKGPGDARNAGIAHASSEYIAFLDADDQWYPWYLANALKAIQDNDVTVVGTTYYEWPKKVDMTRVWAKRNVHIGKYFLRGNENAERTEALMRFFHVGNSLMYTNVARKYDGFYDKDRCLTGEDTVFFMRIVINEKVMIIGPAAVRHNREASGLSHVLYHSLAPMFTEPETVLSYCTNEKRDLMLKVIARFALRCARHKARNGFKEDAIELIRLFPQTQAYRLQYYRCLYEIALSRWFPYWVKFKCAVGPPIRLFLKSVAGGGLGRRGGKLP